MSLPKKEKAAPDQENSLSRTKESTNLLQVAAAHWDQAGVERRKMYVDALQMQRGAHDMIAVQFSDYDTASQFALLGAIVIRCPEMFAGLLLMGWL